MVGATGGKIQGGGKGPDLIALGFMQYKLFCFICLVAISWVWHGLVPMPLTGTKKLLTRKRPRYTVKGAIQ